MRALHVFPPEAEWREEEGRYRLQVTLERPYAEDLHLWYAMPPEAFALCRWDSLDALVLAALLKAMEDRASLRVHGTISPTLLRNLEAFQHIFSAWFKDTYHPVRIEADHEEDLPGGSGPLILSFSGGVDGAFSALCHVLRKGPIRRGLLDIGAILYIEGFDVNIQYEAALQTVLARNRALFRPFPSLPVLPVRTNLKYLLSIKHFWKSHACVVASVATLFRGAYGGCVIGSSHTYNHLLPWGSHPLTDRLLSSHGFEIHHDMAFPRMEKLRWLLAWPEALENLRVCWEGQYRYGTTPDRNCGQCDKCVRTMLAFRAMGEPVPGCFPGTLTEEKVAGLAMRPLDWSRLMFLEEILEEAKAKGRDRDPLFALLARLCEREGAEARARRPHG